LQNDGIDVRSLNLGASIPDQLQTPRAYDAWNLTDVLFDLCYRAGITSRSLFAKDRNGISLVEDNGSRLDKSFIYPFRERITNRGTEVQADFIWEFKYGVTYWDAVDRLSIEFGRPFRFTLDGGADFKLPDNPVLLKTLTDVTDIDNNEFAVQEGTIVRSTTFAGVKSGGAETLVTNVTENEIESKSGIVKDVRGIRAFYWESQANVDNAFNISIRGYGFALIIVRDRFSNAAFSVEIDNIPGMGSMYWTKIQGKWVLQNIYQL
jgi:hypothetical protein